MKLQKSTVPWCIIQGVNPPPEQADSREGFIKETFLTNEMSRREALKCALLQKTFQHKGIPLRSAWLRVAIPYVRTLYLVPCNLLQYMNLVTISCHHSHKEEMYHQECRDHLCRHGG